MEKNLPWNTAEAWRNGFVRKVIISVNLISTLIFVTILSIFITNFTNRFWGMFSWGALLMAKSLFTGYLGVAEGNKELQRIKENDLLL